MGRIGAGRPVRRPAVRGAGVQRERAALARNLGAVACWSVVPAMIRATRGRFSVLFRTFVRYLVSLAVLWPVVLLSGGRDSSRRGLLALLPLLPRILGIAAANQVIEPSIFRGGDFAEATTASKLS